MTTSRVPMMRSGSSSENIIFINIDNMDIYPLCPQYQYQYDHKKHLVGRIKLSGNVRTGFAEKCKLLRIFIDLFLHFNLESHQ